MFRVFRGYPLFAFAFRASDFGLLSAFGLRISDLLVSVLVTFATAVSYSPRVLKARGYRQDIAPRPPAQHEPLFLKISHWSMKGRFREL